MFGKKQDIKVRKLSEIRQIEKAKVVEKQMERTIDRNLQNVAKMDKKTYLKYYIGVLEKQIGEATKVLAQKKRELRFMR